MLSIIGFYMTAISLLTGVQVFVNGDEKYVMSATITLNGKTMELDDIGGGSCDSELLKDPKRLASIIQQKVIARMKNQGHSESSTTDSRHDITEGITSPTTYIYNDVTNVTTAASTSAKASTTDYPVTTTPQPAMYWSMDKTDEDGHLIPNRFTEEDKYINPVENQHGLFLGVEGDALHVADREKLLTGIQDTCLDNIESCEDGLSIAFWINVSNWGWGNFPKPILRTMNLRKFYPGIYFGMWGNSLEIIFITNETDISYEASFPKDLTYNQWTHVCIAWNKTQGIQVALNGSVLKGDQYTNAPTENSWKSVYGIVKTDFDLTAPGLLIFDIDELKIYYQTLRREEIEKLFNSYRGYHLFQSNNSSFATFVNTCGSLAGNLSVISDQSEARKVARWIFQEHQEESLKVFTGATLNSGSPCSYLHIIKGSKDDEEFTVEMKQCSNIEEIGSYALCEGFANDFKVLD